MSDRLCPRCGKPLEAGAAECPDCARPRRTLRLGQQPLVFVGVVLIAAALWTIAHFATRAYAARQDQLAREWYQRGDADLRDGRMDSALLALRTALVYSHDNFAYRLRLAQALLAAHQWRQAEAYLTALWDEQPGNGTVDLELARLAATRGDFEGALRYYHAAIYGFWEHDPATQRRAAHLELVQFLLQRKATQQAESELIALAADLPRDPALLVRVGALFQVAGQPQRALAEYRNALALDARNPAALAGAGEAAFQLRRYEEARGYLQRALAANPQDAHSAELLPTAELVVQLDPFAPRLPADERNRRVLRSLEQAQYRLETCAQSRGLAPLTNAAAQQTPLGADYSQVLALKQRFRNPRLARDSDQISAAMDLVARAERDAGQQCGAPQGVDRALLLIVSRREQVQQ